MMPFESSLPFWLCLLVTTPLALRAAPPATQPVPDGSALPNILQPADVQPSKPSLGLGTDIGLISSPADANVTTNTTPNTTGNTPSTAPSDENRFGDAKLHGPGQGRGRFAPLASAKPSPKEIADAMAYMQVNSPKRYEAINALPEGDRKARFKELATLNYLRWMQVRIDEPDLFPVIQKRVKIEDDIFGLVTQLRREGPDARDATKAQIREKVADLVDVGIKERTIRLADLADTLAKQQKQLANDSANRDALVEDRLSTILSEKNGLVPRDNPPGENGGTGPNPRNHGNNHPPQN